jgi:hypothetical protein
MRPSLLASFLAASAFPAGAQTSPCLAANDQNTAVNGAITSFAFAGPASLAWQFTPPADFAVQAGQLFTQNTFFAQDMTLEIWSDSGSNLPLQRLGGGAWKISMTMPRAWQGTNFDAVVPVSQGVPYWLVWTEPGSSLIPVEPGGNTALSARRASGGTWTTRTADAPKFRLFCNLLDAQNVFAHGTPCAGAAGLGTALTNQAPTVGNADFLVDGTGFPPGQPAVLVLGFDSNWNSIPLPGGPPGCSLHVDPFLLFAGATGTGNVRASTGSAGHVFFPLPIPAVSQLAGLFFATQVAVLDTSFAVPLPFVTSNGLRLVIY